LTGEIEALPIYTSVKPKDQRVPIRLPPKIEITKFITNGELSTMQIYELEKVIICLIVGLLFVHFLLRNRNFKWKYYIYSIPVLAASFLSVNSAIILELYYTPNALIKFIFVWIVKGIVLYTFIDTWLSLTDNVRKAYAPVINGIVNFFKKYHEQGVMSFVFGLPYYILRYSLDALLLMTIVRPFLWDIQLQFAHPYKEYATYSVYLSVYLFFLVLSYILDPAIIHLLKSILIHLTLVIIFIPTQYFNIFLWPPYNSEYDWDIGLKVTGREHIAINFPFENATFNLLFVYHQLIETFSIPSYYGAYTIVFRKYWEFYASLKLVISFESFVFIWLASELVRFTVYLYNRLFGKYNWKFMLLPDVLLTFWIVYPLSVAAEYFWRFRFISAKVANPYNWMT